MIRSMTAFSRREEHVPGAAEDSTQQVTLGWELRSVNHRYLEPGLRLPDALRDLEPAVREALRKRLSRGKIECTLRLGGIESGGAVFAVNEPALASVMQAVNRVAQLAKQPVAIDPVDVLRWPGVTAAQEIDSEALSRRAWTLFEKTLDDFIAAREREGVELAALINQRLDAIGRETERVRAALPQIIEAQRQKLRTRVEEVVTSPDRDRLEQEIAILAGRIDVAEELDRLATHINEVRRCLREGGSVGRKLDFLMQELNREANTLGSKSINADTTQASVEIKVLIEQMREQVQNIE
ncbi:MAG: YicC/YloC family endoribonuclease [Pseudomonadota bacterium]